MASKTRVVGVDVESSTPEIQEAFNGMVADNDDSPYRLAPHTMDPGLHYRFVNLNDGRLAKLFANKDYRYVNRFTDGVQLLQPHILQTPNKEGEDQETADSRVIIGGMVLVCCPRAKFEKRQQDKQDYAALRLRTSTKQDKAIREAENQNITIISEGGPS